MNNTIRSLIIYLLIGCFLSIFIVPNVYNFSNMSNREQGFAIIWFAVSYPILLPLIMLVYLADFLGYLL